VVGDDDVLPRKVPSAPRASPLPLARAVVCRAERAEQRDNEVLRKRVPHEPDPSAPGRGQEPHGVDPRDDSAAAAVGCPGERRELGAAVAEAVPGVAVEGAGWGVERWRRGGRSRHPPAVGRIRERGAAGERLRRGRAWAWGRHEEEEEEDGEGYGEEEDQREAEARHCARLRPQRADTALFLLDLTVFLPLSPFFCCVATDAVCIDHTMCAEKDSGLKDGHKCSFEQSTGIKLHDCNFRSSVLVSIKNLQESD
jgi:hypothetical protein